MGHRFCKFIQYTLSSERDCAFLTYEALDSTCEAFEKYWSSQANWPSVTDARRGCTASAHDELQPTCGRFSPRVWRVWLYTAQPYIYSVSAWRQGVCRTHDSTLRWPCGISAQAYWTHSRKYSGRALRREQPPEFSDSWKMRNCSRAISRVRT